MVDHDLLHRELARITALTSDDFDLNEGLHQLSVTAAAALQLDGAGVTVHMPTGDTEYLTATDAITLRVEQQQDILKQGVCIDAINTAEIVAVGDLSTESRWPQYRPVVLDAGFHAVAGVPISWQGRNIGALNLYASESRAWTTDEFAAARLMADLAAGYLINAHLLGQAQTLANQLQQALESRIVIEQAKGLMAGRYGMTPNSAFELIRSFARGNRLKLHDVARDVVTGELDITGGAAVIEGRPGNCRRQLT